MPDWSYQNIFRHILFRFPAHQARDLTLGTIGFLARGKPGQLLIEFVGHMRPTQANICFLGLECQSRVVLAAGLDAHVLAINALSRFGVGLIEFGAVSLAGSGDLDAVERDLETQSIRYSLVASLDLKTAIERVSQNNNPHLRLMARVAWNDDVLAQSRVIEGLAKQVHAFSLMPPLDENGKLRSLEKCCEHFARLTRVCSLPMLAVLPLELSQADKTQWVNALLGVGVQGFVMFDGLFKAGQVQTNPSLQAVALKDLQQFKTITNAPIIAAGGVFQPRDARDFFEASADLVAIHAGLVFSGPGLVKRINALTNYSAQTTSGNTAWICLCLFGLGMVVAGIVVAIVGITRATLPYDESFLGVSRAVLEGVNPFLLDFLRHDRVTLSGTMISAGLMFAALAFFGVRNGLHWARKSIQVSAIVGFSGFFLFFLYGYFDVLHALVSLILLPFFLIGIYAPFQACSVESFDLENDAVWRLGLIGQLLFVMIGVGLILAGIAIGLVGAIRVFVPEDLLFLQTSAETLARANPKLLALIAHDRSGFGGALWATGLLVLTSSLWGFERGRRWMWYLLLAAGSIGFVATLWIHSHVGYTNFVHLLPAYIGLVLFVCGLIFAAPYLLASRTSQPHHARAAVNLPT